MKEKIALSLISATSKRIKEIEPESPHQHL